MTEQVGGRRKTGEASVQSSYVSEPADRGRRDAKRHARSSGVFVTGTGTEVGKTVVAAVIAHGIAATGKRVAVFKPAVTGLDEPGESDHALLRRAAGSAQSDEEIAPYRYGPPSSPHLAAEMAGEEIEPRRLLAGGRRCRECRRCARLRGGRRAARPAFPRLLGAGPRRRPGAAAGRRGAARSGHDQPHPADDRSRPCRRPSDRIRRPHPVARATEPDRGVQPRDDRLARRGEGRNPAPTRPRRSGILADPHICRPRRTVTGPRQPPARRPRNHPG